LAIFRSRFASLHDIVLVFAACAFPVYSWSIWYSLERLPSWLFYLDAWEIVGIFAYIEAFALVESVAIVLVLLLLAVIVPARLFRDKFVALSSAMITLAAVWTIATQNLLVLRNIPQSAELILLGICLASFGLIYFAIYRHSQLQVLAKAFAERVSVLLYIYIPLSLISLLIVVLRNIG
jgi:hypothetical protein